MKRAIRMTIELNIVTIVYICSCIGIVGGAIKILVEAKKALQKPLDEVNRKLEHYDECLDKDKKHLDKIDILIEELGEAVNILVSANRTTLSHLKEGNHTGEIEAQVKQMDEWLVNRKDYRI